MPEATMPWWINERLVWTFDDFVWNTGTLTSLESLGSHPHSCSPPRISLRARLRVDSFHRGRGNYANSTKNRSSVRYTATRIPSRGNLGIRDRREKNRNVDSPWGERLLLPSPRGILLSGKSMLHFREQFLKTGLLMTCRCVPDSGAIKAITPPVTPLRRRKKKKEKGKKDKREARDPRGSLKN